MLAESFWPFVIAVCAATAAKGAGLAARSPIIRYHGGDRPQEFRAYLRAVTNIGISLGAVPAGWAVQVGTHHAYQLLVIGNAVAFAASAAIVQPQHRHHAAGALAYRRYLGVFGLGAGLAEAIGPALLISLCITWGRPGWYVVGALFALTGLAAPLAVRRAEHQRHGRRPRPESAEKQVAARGSAC
ncbi:hypothetical protein ACIQU4_19340 [Streptomyces sp. NPDC090741]|uniref:hypothetical protein n=1 Tax=Streptomyces sp. NPDC090741 TaxID=3365967 RepID=UPI0038108B29